MKNSQSHTHSENMQAHTQLEFKAENCQTTSESERARARERKEGNIKGKQTERNKNKDSVKDNTVRPVKENKPLVPAEISEEMKREGRSTMFFSSASAESSSALSPLTFLNTPWYRGPRGSARQQPLRAETQTHVQTRNMHMFT